MRVLYIEDDHASAFVIELMLRASGIDVSLTSSGVRGVELAEQYDYDIILLDLNLPDISGLDVLRRIRGRNIQTPIIIVSGTTDINIKVQTFTSGADDYMTKPVHKDELVARMYGAVRRCKGHAVSIIRVGPLFINLTSRIVEAEGVQVKLTRTEYKIAELLFLRKGLTVSKDMILNHLYPDPGQKTASNVNVNVCRIRQKFAKATGGKHYIETRSRYGYRLHEDVVSEIVHE